MFHAPQQAHSIPTGAHATSKEAALAEVAASQVGSRPGVCGHRGQHRFRVVTTNLASSYPAQLGWFGGAALCREWAAGAEAAA